MWEIPLVIMSRLERLQLNDVRSSASGRSHMQMLPPGTLCPTTSAPWLNDPVKFRQEAQLSPRDRAMRRVNWNLANCHATVQKLLIRQVLTKSTVRSWRCSWRQCVINVCTQPWRDRVALIVSDVINKPTTDNLWISPVYRRLAVEFLPRDAIHPRH